MLRIVRRGLPSTAAHVSGVVGFKSAKPLRVMDCLVQSGTSAGRRMIEGTR